MEKFFKIVGIIVVLFIAFSLVGWIFSFLVKTVFWIAIVAGVVYVVASVAARRQIGKR